MTNEDAHAELHFAVLLSVFSLCVFFVGRGWWGWCKYIVVEMYYSISAEWWQCTRGCYSAWTSWGARDCLLGLKCFSFLTHCRCCVPLGCLFIDWFHSSFIKSPSLVRKGNCPFVSGVVNIGIVEHNLSEKDSIPHLKIYIRKSKHRIQVILYD